MIVYPSYGIGSTTDATLLVRSGSAFRLLSLPLIIRPIATPGCRMHSVLLLLYKDTIHPPRSASSILCSKIWPRFTALTARTFMLCSSIITHTIGIRTSLQSVRKFILYSLLHSLMASTGAFAFFGPGQFGKMYTEITQPAAEFRLYFAGEGTSTNHG